MPCLNASAFLDFVDNLTVKELDRIKKHIEKVIEAKRPNDRKFIGSLSANDYVSYFLNNLRAQNPKITG